MPFYGKDWRAPGEDWIKTGSGKWERMRTYRVKLIDHLDNNISKRSIRNSLNDDKVLLEPFSEDVTRRQPCYYVQRSSTKECTSIPSLSEAFDKLDMKFAIHDLRRLAFVRKVLHLLITTSFSNLPGRTQNCVRDLLAEVVNEAVLSQRNTQHAKDLVLDFIETLKRDHYTHIGSKLLWETHHSVADNLLHSLRAASPNTPDHTEPSLFESLPNECILEILQRLSEPKDIQAISRSSRRLCPLAEQDYLWKQMARYHFTAAQIRSYLPPGTNSLDDSMWESSYKVLLRKYGEAILYPTALHSCQKCTAVFWPFLGHSCRVTSESNEDESRSDISKKLSPNDFIGLFML